MSKESGQFLQGRTTVMKGKKELLETKVPQLRVFWGDDHGGEDDQPPAPVFQGKSERTQVENFWAGRNRAQRLSARLVA
jgi:hypothetical protein